MKILMWLVFFGLVIAALYAKITAAKSKPVNSQPNKQFDKNGAELMLRCAHCGVHIPSSEAIQHAGKVYCSEEHRGKPAVF